MASHSVKMTFTLDANCVQSLRKAVHQGIAPSQSALVEEAVEAYLRAKYEEFLEQEYRRAAADPRFLADLQETMEAFG